MLKAKYMPIKNTNRFSCSCDVTNKNISLNIEVESRSQSRIEHLSVVKVSILEQKKEDPGQTPAHHSRLEPNVENSVTKKHDNYNKCVQII
jgi:hypothetical protein